MKANTLTLITPEGSWEIPGAAIPRTVTTDKPAAEWAGENLPYDLYHEFTKIMKEVKQ